MNTTVQLQDPFSYSRIPLIVMGVLLLAYVAYRLILHLLKKKKEKERREKENPAPRIIDLGSLKAQYLAQVCELEKRYEAGGADDREAYTCISSIFRNFVYDATGVEAPKYTLRDIAGLNMPVLYHLIDHCYEPEFSENSESNISESIDMTKRAIELWN